MDRWFNPSHPQTMQAAVFLGYFSAFLGVLFHGFGFLLVAFVAVGAGAFGSANNKRWGYLLLAIGAVVIAFFDVLGLIDVVLGLIDVLRVWFLIGGVSLTAALIALLQSMTNIIFPVALVVAVLHAHSRDYQKAWFE